MTQTIGHVCAKDDKHVPEGQHKPKAKPYRVRVCRDGRLVLVQRLKQERRHPVTCERP